MLNELPRLAPFLKMLHLNKKIYVHINKYAKKSIASLRNKEFIYNALEFFGIERNRIVYGSIESKILYVPKRIHCLNSFSIDTNPLMVNKDNFRFIILRGVILDLLNKNVNNCKIPINVQKNTNRISDPNNSKLGRILYIQRKNSRRIINRKKLLYPLSKYFVVDILNEKDYFTVCDFYNDLYVFTLPDIIIGMHQSILSNVIVAPRDSSLIEVRSFHYKNYFKFTAYFQVSNAVGIKFISIFGNTYNSIRSVFGFHDAADTDVVINYDLLISTLGSIIEK